MSSLFSRETPHRDSGYWLFKYTSTWEATKQMSLGKKVWLKKSIQIYAPCCSRLHLAFEIYTKVRLQRDGWIPPAYPRNKATLSLEPKQTIHYRPPKLQKKKKSLIALKIKGKSENFCPFLSERYSEKTEILRFLPQNDFACSEQSFWRAYTNVSRSGYWIRKQVLALNRLVPVAALSQYFPSMGFRSKVRDNNRDPTLWFWMLTIRISEKAFLNHNTIHW